MIVFLLSAVPVFALWVTSSLFERSERHRGLLGPVLYGLASWAVFYVAYLLIQGAVTVTFSWGGLYAFYLFHHTGFPVGVALLGYLLFVRFRGGMLAAFAFTSAFFLLIAIHDVITQLQYFNIYLLFLLPLLRVAIILFLTGALELASRLRSWARYGMTMAIPAFAGFCTLVPMFVYESRPLFAYLSTGVAVIGASLMFWLVYVSRDAVKT